MRLRLAPPLVTAVLLLTSCTGGDEPASGGAAAPEGGSDAVPSATTSPPDQQTVVATGRTPAALAVSVSEQLFDSAPAVVVAGPGDPAAVRAAADKAEQLGVPLLLDDGTGTAVAAEVRRLGADTVIVTSDEVGARLGGIDGAEVVTGFDRLPAVGRPEALADVAVLVRAGAAAGGDAAGDTAGDAGGDTAGDTAGDAPGDAAGEIAATATARAAGATVVPVRGTDPRSDPKAIAALSESPPRHVLATSGRFGTAERLAARVEVAATGAQLPGGGQVVVPGRRLVAMYGHPGSPALGVLGEQPVDAAIARAKSLAAPYQELSGALPVVPTFEIITTVATAGPGPDGNYSFEAPLSLIKPWVDKAGAAGVYVVLDLQPGRTDFLTQAKRYEPLLKLPHVGLALDPEWRLKPGEKHLTQIGSVTAQEVNSVYRWLADLTARERLPQKLFVLHQFRLSMIGDDEPLQRDRDEVALLIHMDGQGPTGSKDQTWAAVVAAAPKGVPFGWKNFYDEDSPMLTPAQTMTREPTPMMISYQ